MRNPLGDTLKSKSIRSEENLNFWAEGDNVAKYETDTNSWSIGKKPTSALHVIDGFLTLDFNGTKHAYIVAPTSIGSDNASHRCDDICQCHQE